MNYKYNGQGERRFTMRMPLETYEALAQQAKTEKRSVCNMLIVLVHEALQKRKAENKEPASC